MLDITAYVNEMTTYMMRDPEMACLAMERPAELAAMMSTEAQTVGVRIGYRELLDALLRWRAKLS